MTNPEAADTIQIPESWAKHLLPWRGKRHGPEVELRSGAPIEVADAITRHRNEIEAALARPENAGHAAPVLEHLAGAPDPTGAAIAMYLLETSQYGNLEPGARETHLDGWVIAYGLPFAAAAMAEAMVLNAGHANHRKSGIVEKTLHEINLHHIPWYWNGMVADIRRIRALLARATDAEYQAALAAIAPLRTDPVRRIAAAMLMPTEIQWADQGCAEQSDVGSEWVRWEMVSTPAHVAAGKLPYLRSGQINEQHLAAMLDGLGADALPVLAATLDQPEAPSTAGRSLLIQAIALIPGEDAVDLLIERLDTPGALTALLGVAEKRPAPALRAIARRAPEAVPDLRVKLAGIAKTTPGLLNDGLPQLDPADRTAIADLVDESHLIPAAPADELPPLLVAPPWTIKSAKRKEIVVEGIKPPTEGRLAWAEGEQERWAVLDESAMKWAGPDFWAKRIERARKHSRFDDSTYFFSWAPVDIAASLLDKWDGSAPNPFEIELMRILGRFGLKALDRVTPLIKTSADLSQVILPIEGLEVARLAADWLARLKSRRPVAKQWLDRHAPAAARLLIPDALGADKSLRRAANVALRYLIAFHSMEAVAAAAKAYGEDAAAAITAMAEVDPLDPGDVTIPKPPIWANPAMLPQILLKGRELALPSESVRHLTTVLAIATPEFPYAGIDVIAETCDRDSLAEYSWDLFEQWIAAGAPPKDGWALTQLAHFADDAAVRRLTSMVRAWPGQSQHKRAVTALEVLGQIGSEAALRAIHGIAQKVKFKALKEKASEQIEAIAANLDLTTEQLADRLVPDFGLDEASTLLLDYGPRQFKVGFDEQLKPFVNDADGKRLKNLPKPGAKDDAELAEAAYKRFSQLKKDLRMIAKDQVERLERAMIDGRTWTAGEFREFFVDHPLAWHLARRLIWLAETDDLQRAFRLAEDKNLTDVDDEEFDLPEDAHVSLVHPARLGGDLAGWGEVLADYEILQPFDQLSRPVMAFTAEELETGRLTRFEGVEIEAVRALGMTHWGWQRASPEDGGCEPGLYYRLPGHGFVVLSLEPGLYAGYVAELPEQTVRSVYLSDTEDYWAFERDEDHPHPTGIDPVTASEVLGMLARIAQTS